MSDSVTVEESADLLDSERIDSLNITEAAAGLASAASSQEDEELTAEEVLNRLETAWVNEKFAPDLLEPQMEVVECLTEQIRQTEDEIRRRKSSGPVGKGMKDENTLHRMEMARVRFLISSYLRLRLQKIQQFVFHLCREVQENPQANRMTKEELTFANEYKNNLETLYNDLALKHLPGRAAELNIEGTKRAGDHDGVPKPNHKSMVFVQAVKDVYGLVIEDDADRGRDEEYDMEAGSQHILNFKAVSGLLRKGDVKLM